MRIYVPWEYWECQKSGMWRTVTKEEHELLLKKSIKFISNHILYGKNMIKVVCAWRNSMNNFLSNPSLNKLAYIGHCAAQYAINCPESITREAWSYLTDEQRMLANNEAMKALYLYKKLNRNGYQINLSLY